MAPRLPRLLTVLWALAAAVMPGGLAVLDAGAEATVYAVEAHVEQEGGTSCPESHDPHCAVCSTLRAGRTEPPAATAIPAATRVMRVPPLLWSSGHALVAARTAAQPRAPPAAT